MARALDPQLRLWWRPVIDDFDPRQSTIADFCRQRRISQPSFYKWRKKLAKERDAKERDAPDKQQRQPACAAFVPIHVVDQAKAIDSGAVQVHLPNGVRIDVPGGQPQLLWQLIENVSLWEEKNTSSRGPPMA